MAESQNLTPEEQASQSDEWRAEARKNFLGCAVFGLIMFGGCQCYNSVFGPETPQQKAARVQVKEKQKSNVLLFQHKMAAPELVASVEADPSNPNRVWINLEKPWDDLLVRRQDVAKSVWFNDWVRICQQNPTGSNERVGVSLFKPDGGLLDVLYLPEESDAD